MKMVRLNLIPGEGTLDLREDLVVTCYTTNERFAPSFNVSTTRDIILIGQPTDLWIGKVKCRNFIAPAVSLQVLEIKCQNLVVKEITASLIEGEAVIADQIDAMRVKANQVIAQKIDVGGLFAREIRALKVIAEKMSCKELATKEIYVGIETEIFLSKLPGIVD